MAKPEPDYSDVFGDAFLDRAIERRDRVVLDRLWRAGEPSLAVRLVPRLFELDDPRLTSQIVDEIVEPRLGTDVATAIARQLSQKPLHLNVESTKRLAERLMNQDSLNHALEQQRAVLQRGVIDQDHRGGDRFILDLFRGKVRGLTDRAIRAAAMEHIRDDDRLGVAACKVAMQDLREGDDGAWPRGAELVETLGSEHGSQESKTLMRELVRRAPAQGISEQFGDVLSAKAVEHVDVALQLLQGDQLPSTPGTVALTRWLDRWIGDDSGRAKALATLVERQPASHDTLLKLADEWTNWDPRLMALRAAKGPLPQRFLRSLLTKADPWCADDVVRIALRDDASADLLPIAASKVNERANQLIDGPPDAWSAQMGRGEYGLLLPWDRDGSELRHFAELTDIVGRLESRARLYVLTGALEEGNISPAEMLSLLPAGDELPLVETLLLFPHPQCVADVIAAFFDGRPDAGERVVTTLQQRGFRLDVASGAAGRSAAAFAGAADVYDDLDTDQRGALLALLEAHGTWEQRGLISKFAGDGAKASRPQRAAALQLAGRLCPKDADVPDYFRSALSANSSDVANAALEAIAEARPRDLALTRTLRDIASSHSQRTAAAAHALDALVAAWSDRVMDAPPHGERLQLLELIGAAARPGSVDPLLRHVGGETVIDNPEAQRAAAAALVEVTETRTPSDEEINRLGAAIDGDEAESDPQARAHLGVALSKALLGEERALAKLYDLLDFRPRPSASDLFGADKDQLVRQFDLYLNETKHGEPGRRYAITHLDNVAERIARQAYLAVGESEPMKATIAADPTKPDYGTILGAMQGKVAKAKPSLQVLHDLRNDKTEVPHPGTDPTAEDMDRAVASFRHGAKILIGVLDNRLRGAP